MPNSARREDYESKKLASAKIAADSHAKYIKEAQALIAKSVTKSAKSLIKLTNTATQEDATRLNAIKHHLKLAGLEIERVEHTGDPIQVFLPEVSK